MRRVYIEMQYVSIRKKRKKKKNDQTGGVVSSVWCLSICTCDSVNNYIYKCVHELLNGRVRELVGGGV